jgi:FlaA1/EpsC-like NDP-sugar epimerase
VDRLAEVDALPSHLGGEVGHSKRRRLPERIAAHLRRDLPLAILDACIVFGAYLVPLVLRFEAAVPERYWFGYRTFVPVAAFVHLVANYLFGLYGQMWRYASVQEARRVVISGVGGGALVFVASLFSGGGVNPLPKSVVILGSILSFLGFGAMRFQSRLFALRRGSVSQERARVLVVGAGDGGAAVVKDLLRNPSFGLDPVGLVDDDARKVGRSLHGVPVVDRLRAIPTFVERHSIDQVLLAIPSATSGLVRDVAALCEQGDVVLRVLPSVKEAIAGRITARDIRDLRIEDLLGRQQVDTDLDSVAGILQGRRVLVTGAGGSIGAEISRQVNGFAPASLVLVDSDETHLHDILVELDGDSECEGVLADVRDGDKMLAVFMRYRPEVVFHAAAHKHVPVLETYPEEALFTNVIGTANVVDAAVAAGVDRFVLISTDKAVKPASVMGSSKWFAEQLIWSAQFNGSQFSAVRFGNVLGSRGSVIPTFFRQIAQGGPVTVTDPDMTRYFMSVHEAVQLVLQATALSRGGEVFTLEMGEPINVLELARDVIRLSGRVPGKDVEIRITGRRPGEKVMEDIVNADEEQVPSGHPAITAARPPVPDRGALRRAVSRLETLAREGRSEELAVAMKLLAGIPLEPERTEMVLEPVGNEIRI